MAPFMVPAAKVARYAADDYRPHAFDGAGGVLFEPGGIRMDAPDLPFFVDWLSLNQTHPEGGLPVVDAGCVWAVDEHGVMQWRTTKAVRHEGSHETSLSVKCDGHRVTLSGNVGRYGRPDNVFGFGVAACLRVANEVLGLYGLPPFTAGHRVAMAKRGEVRYAWTGARISRIDLTANFSAGSVDDAHLVMQYLGSQHAGRKSGRVLGQGETVDWGGTGNGKDGDRGSRRIYAKAYIKHLEMARHGSGTPELIEWCRDAGIVRYELTARSRTLSDLGCAYLGDYERGWAMGQLVNLFNEHSAVLHRAERSVDELDALPRELRSTARDYLAGMDMTRELSRATFYRHRAKLLPFGIDISVRNVTPFRPRVRVVQLAPAVMPSWYQLAA